MLQVLLQRHMIDGRWCDIKIPDSQDKREGNKDKSSCKIFVGRVTENLTKEDLRDHFEAFGQVTDVYIPTPFRQFAFVQFSESKAAQSLLGKEHLIKVSLNKVWNCPVLTVSTITGSQCQDRRGRSQGSRPGRPGRRTRWWWRGPVWRWRLRRRLQRR